ncbi:hypothetical protein BN1095_3950001 [Clostridioides difficile]|uniref:Uncharacterized protein n=1 Tax=Clostridioides difficile TaxID=1496 RepID=A0A069APT8_CLODI|nr:hypothetical protein BN1095_3950001 [Clostridioides difficile]
MPSPFPNDRAVSGLTGEEDRIDRTAGGHGFADSVSVQYPMCLHPYLRKHRR